MLGKITGYEPSHGYILGRKWFYSTRSNTYRGNGWFDRLGAIDFADMDSDCKTKVLLAAEWIRRLRKESENWKTTPPSIAELYPNMTVKNSWGSIKRKIAEEIGEITLLWQCGYKNRLLAHKLGIYSWRDPLCTPQILGITGKYAPILQAIIDINRQSHTGINNTGRKIDDTGRKIDDTGRKIDDIRQEINNIGSEIDDIRPKKIPSNYLYPYNAGDHPLEFFVDFETVNALIREDISPGPAITGPRMSESLMASTAPDIIFMIGIGCIVDGTYQHRTFYTEKLTHMSERKMCNDLHQYILGIQQSESRRVNKSCTSYFYHWGHYEPTQ